MIGNSFFKFHSLRATLFCLFIYICICIIHIYMYVHTKIRFTCVSLNVNHTYTFYRYIYIYTAKLSVKKNSLGPYLSIYYDALFFLYAADAIRFFHISRPPKRPDIGQGAEKFPFGLIVFFVVASSYVRFDGNRADRRERTVCVVCTSPTRCTESHPPKVLVHKHQSNFRHCYRQDISRVREQC